MFRLYPATPLSFFSFSPSLAVCVLRVSVSPLLPLSPINIPPPATGDSLYCCFITIISPLFLFLAS